MTKSSKFQSPYLEMKLLTNDEFQEYKNHSCKEYVRQGKTFKYDKMDLLNKKYLEPKLDEQPETTTVQSPEQQNAAGDLTDSPSSQNADIAQQDDNSDATVDLNSADAQRSINVDDGDNADDAQSITTPSIIEEPEQNKNDSLQDDNLSMPTSPADTARVKNVIQGKKNVTRPASRPIFRPHICSQCNNGFTTDYSLRRHIGTVHNKDWVRSSYKKKGKEVNNNKSVFVPLPVPMPVLAKNNVKTKSVPMPTTAKNVKKRSRKFMESDDDVDLQPPPKSFIESTRKKTKSAPIPTAVNVKKRSRNLMDSDDDDYYLQPPSKSYIQSGKSTRKSTRKKDDEEEEYRFF